MRGSGIFFGLMYIFYKQGNRKQAQTDRKALRNNRKLVALKYRKQAAKDINNRLGHQANGFQDR
jgi:hypothetical protein